MTDKKPLKRSKELRSFSVDHHHGLLLSWKIRTGFKKGIEVKRMANYVEWFYQNHLMPHFKLEEQYMFPVLGDADPDIVKALDDHRELTALIENRNQPEALHQLADALEAHIRFEERVLFGRIQQAATPDQLTRIEQIHDSEKFVEHHDEFWK